MRRDRAAYVRLPVLLSVLLVGSGLLVPASSATVSAQLPQASSIAGASRPEVHTSDRERHLASRPPAVHLPGRRAAPLAGTDEGRITGTVTGPDGRPLPKISVIVYAYDDTGVWYPWDEVSTGSSGHYDLGPLAAGPYRLQFFAPLTNYVEEFWRDAETVDSAATIRVKPDVESVADAQLARGAAIQGAITSVNGASTAGIEVRAYFWNTHTKTWDWRYYVASDSRGRYDMSGLRSGKWRIGFAYEDDTYYAQYWDGSPTLARATTIATVAGKNYPGHDARLSEPAVASGTVTDTNGDPAGDTNVYVYAWSASAQQWFLYNNEYTEPDGSYWTGGLEPGSYLLEFSDNVTLEREYWDDALTSTTAVQLRVHDNDEITGIDVQFSDGSLLDVVNTGLPTTTGVARVGQALAATSGTWGHAGAPAVAYRWFADGVPVPGATSATYVPAPSDVGQALQVQVRASSPGYTSTTAASSPRIVAAGSLRAVTKAKVVGKAKKNATLRVSPGAWSPSEVAVRYQWFAGAKAIPKAIRPTLKLVGTTLRTVTRKAISVVATVAAPGYNPVTSRLKVAGKVR
ncbi:hypothetical protein GCM10009795_060860 [Nocardioides hankookensis]|uniref:Carboxypeptidase regulatory-like domain-containing protein n=1 Tax=Nocardioides hankookensis TaxID=443157 RepID=A0ABW1LMP5_9ACTN